MRYLIILGVGVLTGLATAILWVVVSFVLPVALPVLLSRIRTNEAGVGMASAFITSGSITGAFNGRAITDRRCG